ncbi:TPA: L-lactate dehydrogenase [Candidatus Falkowbacteria bacterium]|nr:MAG: L-lactate dehydrogenase [Candidatus Falkowbacteria bacterium GW2011_GWF2_43_32]HBA36929.1 L-lactate dehydrogenase [Candidatus Falkowbacteria bacterium]
MTKNKVSIIGAGMVGSTTAYSLIAAQIAEEVAMIDINSRLNRSQVMDLQHSVPFWGYTEVKTGTINDLKDSRVVVIACGASQKPGETRLDLLKINSKIIKDLMSEIFKKNPRIVVIIVTNPVDILTNIAVKMFPGHKNQIFGSGTILDTARFRFLLGEKLSVDPKSLHAYIIGEHGDSEVPLWSKIMIGNTFLDRFQKINKKEKENIFNNAKNAAYAIIAGKQATYYAIAAGVTHLVEAVLFDKKTVFTVSHSVDGRFGIKDVCLSLPAVIGEKGILKKIDIQISDEEKRLLKISAAKLKKAEKEIK